MNQVVSAEQVDRLRPIKLLLLDVDGVLTDCRVFLDANGDWKRFFSIRDGYGIKKIMDAGYKVGIITGSKARDIQERAKALGVHYFVEGTLDKQPAFERILIESGFKASEVAYMGDDDFDVPVLRLCGFASTVPEAMEQVFENVHYVAVRPGGNGAVREVCELIFKYGALSTRGSA